MTHRFHAILPPAKAIPIKAEPAPMIQGFEVMKNKRTPAPNIRFKIILRITKFILSNSLAQNGIKRALSVSGMTVIIMATKTADPSMPHSGEVM